MGALDPNVSQYLLDDENELLVDEIRRHWVTRIPAILLILLGAVAAGLVPGAGSYWFIPAIAAALIFGRGFYLLAKEQLDRFVVTNMRVFRVHGVFNRHLAIVPIARILDISVNRPFLGMIFGYGHFVFESAAQEQGLREIKFVPNILRHDRIIQTIIARSGVRAQANISSAELEDS